MHRSGNDFTYIHNLKRGKHAFKFIVDDEWRFAPDQPTVADIEGRINNFIDVTDFKAYTGDKEFESERHADHCARTATKAAEAAASASTQSDQDNSSSVGSNIGKGQRVWLIWTERFMGMPCRIWMNIRRSRLPSPLT